jgi:hypothetical protein
MKVITYFLAGAFGLTALYLVVFNANQSNQVLSGLAQFNAQTFRTLQGR